MLFLYYIKMINSFVLRLIVCSLFFLLLLQSCDFSTHLELKEQSQEGRIHLTFTLRNEKATDKANFTKSENVLKSNPTINTDGLFFEDRVRELVVYIYDSQTGEMPELGFRAYGGLPINKAVSFVVDFPQGTYDFYFIANMPTTGENASSSLGSREVADNYLKQLRTLPPKLFTGPKGDAEGDELFPMARVYKNQVIKINPGSNIGTSERNPIPFRPINENGIAEDYVLLNRAIAKIDATINVSSSTTIQSVKLINGVKEYSLQTADEKSDALNEMNNVFKELTDRYLLYTPEIIQPAGLKWNEDLPGAHINYLEIRTKTGDTENTYNVPIASNYTIADGNYMEFVKGKKAIFDIRRNDYYSLKISLNEHLIDVHLEILPFEEVDITGEAYPSIVNVEKRMMILDENGVGTLHFSFVSHDVDASDYMKFVGVSEEPEGEFYGEDVVELIELTEGYFRLKLDFSEYLVPHPMFLHFKNTKMTSGLSDILIPIFVEEAM